ncbi:MAG: dihydrolipoyl dehydrogenase [Oligosphaeraceae bacterium]|nr:dihydrolipoyl dehydrogenase [Oligosphaeraceae bacterium]
MRYDLLVIGAGPGGYEAAAYAARMGKKVALFEKEELGGVCLNVGCIPTKTMLRSSKALDDCRQASAFGIQAEGKPVLDMAAVQARKRKVISTLIRGVAGMLKGAGVEVVKGEARIVSPGLVSCAGQQYAGDHILIATGSLPAQPPIPGLKDNPAVLDSSGILELQEIPKELLIIGGGVIGLEFACFFASVGSKVNVVEMLPRIATVVDEEIGKRLMAELEKQGIVFKLSCQVQRIEGNTLTYKTADGKEEKLSADYILNSTGRRPVTEGLGLEELGMVFDRRGIKTDIYGKTNIPGIWACGDVTGRLLLAHAATREGQVAVNNMFGKKDHMRYNAIPSVIYTQPEVAHVGASEEELKKQGIAYRKVVMPMAIAGRFLVDYEGKNGTVKALFSKEHGHLLGLHAIGGCCGEFIASAVQMVEMEMRPEEISQIVFPHPTISEALKETLVR